MARDASDELGVRAVEAVGHTQDARQALIAHHQAFQTRSRRRQVGNASF